MNQKNTKILFILPSMGLGGAEKNTLFLANYYIKLGYSVCIVIFTNDLALKDKIDERVQFYEINSFRIRGGLWGLIKIIKLYKPKIIYANLWPITFIAQCAKIFTMNRAKLIMVEHINLSQGLQDSSFHEKLLAKFVHFFFRIINTKFIAVSTGVKRDLIKKYGLRSSQVEVIYNPVINEIPSAYNKSRDIITDFTKEIKILSIGNLKKQKNYENLIKAIDILINRGFKIKCLILGDGGERSNLLKLVEELKLNKSIIFLGSRTDVENYYILTDVFVLSSAYEGLGNVLIEALSYGCRIVSTDCDSGPREILEHGKYGVLVEKGNPVELANGIEKSLSIPINQVALRKKSLEFLVNSIGDKYLEV